MLTGTIVPLVTPFHADGTLDREALSHLVRHILGAGVDALMPTALTGEGPLLSRDETFEVWETVFDTAEGRAPILPAIITFTTEEALARIRRAQALGATGAMVAPIVPELYAGRSERDVVEFYQAVARASSLPLTVFNYPSLTGVDFTPEILSRLATIDSVRHVKESTGDSRRIAAVMRRLGDRVQVVCGAPTAALECLALGCTAWITGVLNLVPRQGRALMRAVHDVGDLALARKIHFEQILPLVDAMERTRNPTGIIKSGLALQGVDVGGPRRPGQALSDTESAELGTVLDRIAESTNSA